MKRIINNSCLIAIILSFLALSYAYFVEYILDFTPCKLCLIQRWSFFALIFVSLIGFIKKTRHIAIYSQILILSSSLLLSSFHLSLENELLQPLNSCSNNVDFSQDLSAKELLEQIRNTKATNCNKASFSLLGISMTGWNLLFNFTMMIYVSFINFRKEYE